MHKFSRDLKKENINPAKTSLIYKFARWLIRIVITGLISFLTIKIAIEIYVNLNFKKPHPGRGPNITGQKFESLKKFMDAP